LRQGITTDTSGAAGSAPVLAANEASPRAGTLAAAERC
jgi:hypothetical protein